MRTFLSDVDNSSERREEIVEEGKNRYKNEIPPGYRDASKKDDTAKKYGDLLLWFQVIDKATKEKKPVILVTDDTKDDWWYKFHGKTIGPRPELIEEMLAKTEMDFYMYQSDQFMEYARNYLKQEVGQKAIDEVRGIREKDEQTLRRKELKMTQERIMDLQEEIAQTEVRIDRIIRRISNMKALLDELQISTLEEDAERQREVEGTLRSLSNERATLERRLEKLRSEYAHLSEKRRVLEVADDEQTLDSLIEELYG